jgi:hypothetical protein
MGFLNPHLKEYDFKLIRGHEMNFRQVIQTGPVKANELFAKLSDTSDAAVKTREKMFEELKAELELHADLEEQHLFPVLRKNKKTKNLVPDAIRDNKELRATLSELDALPKDDEAFLEKLAELRKGFQRHVRDEKKELLPAVRKALSTEQAHDIAERFANGMAEAEQIKRDEAEQKRLESKRERDRAEQQAAAEEATERAQKATARRTRDNVRNAAEAMERTVEAAHNGAREAAENITNGVQRAATGVLGAVSVYRDSADTTAQGLQAVAASYHIAARGMTEIRSAWMSWMVKAMNAHTQASQQLMRCRTPRHVAEVQRGVLADAMQGWMENNARILQISRRVTEEALHPLEGRLGARSETQRISG